MRPLFIATTVASLISGTAIADESQCTTQQQDLNGVGSKYKPQFDEYQQEGDGIKQSSAQFNVSITWDNVDIIFGLPSVTIKNQDIILGLPQVTMKTQEITFGTPSVRMERHQTGEYPEFTCDHAFIPSCTVHWSPIYVDVPVPFLQQQHIKLDLPEFTFADTKITLGVPEFSIVQQHWIVGLPQFRLDSVYLNSGEIKDRSDALQTKIANTRSAMVHETAGGIHALYECEGQGLAKNRADAEAKFSSGLAVLDAVIQNMRSQGADPSKMPDGSDLTANRAALEQKRQEVLKKFDDALAALNDLRRTRSVG